MYRLCRDLPRLDMFWLLRDMIGNLELLNDSLKALSVLISQLTQHLSAVVDYEPNTMGQPGRLLESNTPSYRIPLFQN